VARTLQARRPEPGEQDGEVDLGLVFTQQADRVDGDIDT
jgi:hypothetical protein